jgi:hypothetical protein
MMSLRYLMLTPSFHQLNDNKLKVFCIGLNKTGTTSLVDAWKELGYTKIYSGFDKPTLVKVMSNKFKFKNNNIINSGFNRDYDILRQLISGYECMKDRPFNTNNLYRWLDKNYYNSKFILTIRDDEEWWESVNKWLTSTLNLHETEEKTKKKIDLYKKHFNTTEFTKDSFITYYQDYNNKVKEYFKGNPNFLEINICNGEGWELLCPFLGKTIPNKEFPKSNVNI